jgi:uncharacterized membrane protein
MSDPVTLDSPAPAAAEDKVLPAVIYALYLVGVANGLTVILGLILAYVSRDRAGPKTRTHYDFLIRTFWMTLGWAILGTALIVVGIPLSFVLIGLPLLFLGWAILALLCVWFIVRSVMGVIYLARDEAHPRPDTWLI